MMIQRGVVNFSKGETALHVATAKEFKDVVSLLIENKANLLIENNVMKVSRVEK